MVWRIKFDKIRQDHFSTSLLRQVNNLRFLKSAHCILDFLIPTKKAWGLGLTIRSTNDDTIDRNNDSVDTRLGKKVDLCKNKANHLCPKTLLA